MNGITCGFGHKAFLIHLFECFRDLKPFVVDALCNLSLFKSVVNVCNASAAMLQLM